MRRRQDNGERVQRVMQRLVAALVQRGELQLHPGAEVDALVDRLVHHLTHKGGFAQLGATVSAFLCADPAVDDFFLDDAELVARLSDLG